jgi:hypothetical protein
MKSVKPAILTFLAFTLCLIFAACGKGSVPINIGPLSVATRSLPTAVVQKPYNATLAASGGQGPYTWTITSGSLPNGISMSADGVVSGTPTTKTTTPAAITVQVTDSQKPTAAVASGALSMTVNDQLAITTKSLRSGAVNVPYSVTMTATGGAAPYTWAIASGSLPDGLTLNPQFGTISGTPTTEGTSKFTVSVTDSESPAVVLTQDLTITIGGSAARLSGNYVFLFRGFKNGKLLVEAGSFVSDGNGTITSGTADIVTNNAGGNSHINVAVHGTYTLLDSGQGTMSLIFGNGNSGDYQIAAATATASPYFEFIQNGDGQATTSGAGLIKTQATIPADLSSFGNANGAVWAFGGYGVDSANNRFAAGGNFKLTFNTGDPSATISSGLMDINDNGQMTIGKALSGSLTTPDATTGRGTATLGTAGSTGSLAYYFIGASNGSLELVAVDTDPPSVATPLILYSLRKQNALNGGYTNLALQGTTITELSSVPSANGPDVSLGMLDFDGKGTVYATIDDNNAGTVTQNKFTGSYSVDTTGRTTFTGWNGSNPIMYLWSFESGYMLGQDPAVTAGELEFQNVQTQTHNPSNSDFTGAYSGGTVAPILASQTVEADTFSADGATPGNLTGTYDISGGGNPPQQGLQFKTTYNIDSSCPPIGTASSTTCGRFALTDANNNQVGVGYLANIFGPNRVVILKTNTPQPVINILQK